MTIARSLAHPLARPLAKQLGAVCGGWSPQSLANLRQWFLDQGGYHSSRINGIPVLKPLESYGTFRAPRQGRCYLFDGTDDYVALPNFGFSGDDEFTLSCWVRFDTAKDYHAALAIGTTGTALRGAVLVAMVNGRFGVAFAGANDAFSATGLVTQDGSTLYHLAATKSAGAINTQTKLFINGSEVAVDSGSTSTPNITEGGNGAIGRLAENSPHLKGICFGCHVFDDVLTSDEITYLYTHGPSGTAPTNLVAKYNCNEESGTVGYDSSGNGNNGTLTSITQSTFHATDSDVVVNSANEVGHSKLAYFDGSANISTGYTTSITDLTIIATIRADEASYETIAGKDASGDRGWVFSYRDNSGTAYLTLESNGGFGGGISDLQLSLGVEYRVAIKVNGTTGAWKMWRDATTKTGTRGTAIPSQTAELLIGNRGFANSGFGGTIRDIEVYDSELSDSDVEDRIAFVAIGATPVVSYEGYGDTDGDWLDNSGNGNHGTANGINALIIPRDESDTDNDVIGNPLQFVGKSPYPPQVNVPCLAFDGTDSIVETDAVVQPSAGTDSFTFAVWSDYDFSGDEAAFGTNGSGTNHYWALADGAMRIHIGGSSNAVTSAFCQFTNPTSTWNHFAVSWDGSAKEASFYLNGELVESAKPISTPTKWASSLCMGSRRTSSPLTMFTNEMADARVYQSALSAAEIEYLYNRHSGSATDPGTDDLEGRWKMQDGAGNILIDDSGNENHGTLTDFALDNAWANTTNVVEDHSINYGGQNVGFFDGIDNAITVSDDAVFDATVFTLSAFVNSTGWAAAYATILRHGGFGGGLFVRNKKIVYHDGADRITSSTILTNDGVWYHIAIVSTGTTLDLYLNGVSDATQVAYAADLTEAADIGIGYIGGNPHGGGIHSVRFHGAALSAANLLYLATCGASGTDPGTDDLELELLLDAVATDSSGNGRDGTPSGVTYPFIPALTDGTLPIAQSPAATRAAGKFGNANSKINANPYTAAELNGLGAETDYSLGDTRQDVAPNDTKFRRTGGDGDDRFFATDDALTGDPKSAAEAYTQ